MNRVKDRKGNRWGAFYQGQTLWVPEKWREKIIEPYKESDLQSDKKKNLVYTNTGGREIDAKRNHVGVGVMRWPRIVGRWVGSEETNAGKVARGGTYKGAPPLRGSKRRYTGKTEKGAGKCGWGLLLGFLVGGRGGERVRERQQGSTGSSVEKALGR